MWGECNSTEFLRAANIEQFCTHSQALCEDFYWVLTRKAAGRVGDQKAHPSVVQMWRRSVGAGGKP